MAQNGTGINERYSAGHFLPPVFCLVEQFFRSGYDLEDFPRQTAHNEVNRNYESVRSFLIGQRLLEGGVRLAKFLLLLAQRIIRRTHRDKKAKWRSFSPSKPSVSLLITVFNTSMAHDDEIDILLHEDGPHILC